jgi:hypothetical protein
MHNLAYKLEFRPAQATAGSDGHSDLCPACGNELFGPDAEACSWQAWGTFWEILEMTHVELVCGSCGAYLRDFFNQRK